MGDVFVRWLWLSILTRLAMDRMTVFGFSRYDVTSSPQIGVFISLMSLLAVSGGGGWGPMLVWAGTYLVTWLIDPRSPSDVWRQRVAARS